MQRKVLIILFILFLLPGPLAYLFYSHPHWVGQVGTNKGVLIKPPIQITALSTSRDLWQVVYWSPTISKSQLHEHTDRLARIRLALGRLAYRVSLVIWSPAESLKRNPLPNGIHWLTVLAPRTSRTMSQRFEQPGIFIVDPQGYVVLYYTDQAPMDDIYHDLKRLLKTEE